jgi:hypothetical protein
MQLRDIQLQGRCVRMGDSFLRRLSIKHLWVFAVLIGVFAFVNTHPIRPHDFWWHMAIGREIVDSGEIQRTELYSYTIPGPPSDSYKMFWLADVGIYAVYTLGGAPLSILIQSLIVTLAYAVILLLCFRISGSCRVAAFGAIFAAALGINNWNLRPQIVTYLLGALFLWAIYEYRMRPRKGWLLVFPALMFVWVNCHGSFLIGLALLGMWLLEEIVRAFRARLSGVRPAGSVPGRVGAHVWPPVIALFVTVLAAMVNPRGIGVFHYLMTLMGDPVVRNMVPEWAPPSFGSPGGIQFYVGLLLTTMILAYSPRRPDFVQAISFLGFAALALKTTRGIVWYGLVLAPVLSDHAFALYSKVRRSKHARGPSGGVPAINLAILGFLLFIAVISLPWFKHVLRFPAPKAGLISAETPVEATRFLLDEHPPPPAFHALSFGSYLIWAAQPDYRVFVDWLEAYPPEIWHDYLLISNAGRGWNERLQSYGVRTLMLSPEEQPTLLDTIKARSDWQEVYQDPNAVIFVRTEPSGP